MTAPHCVSASHAVLFEKDEPRCACCSEVLAHSDDDDADGPVSGKGLLVWSRGEERRYEEPELCPRCASAIGMTALHRWEIEEEEG